MPTEDGSIVIRATIDDKDAEKKLKSLNSQIDRLEEKINKTQAKRSPLAEQALELGAALDAAKQKLYEMQSAGTGAHVSAAQLTAQKENVAALQAQYNAVQSQVERYDKQLKDANFDLEYAKQQAGELHRQLARTGPAAEKMAAAMDRAQKSAKRFGGRLREVLRSALIFTVISQGLASFRDWMGKVIRTNAEAQEAFAKLKGALLTLAQPLVEVIIPALTAFVNGLTRIVTVVAQLVSRLFGKTISQSQEAAKGLYEETEALESVGGAAEEAAGSLAGFDEINTIQTENASISGGGMGGIEADFSAVESLSAMEQYKKKIDEFTVYLSGAALVLGTILFFSGVNIPLGLGLMALGAAGLAAEVKENWDTADGKIREAINKVLLIGGILLLVIGLLLAFSGVKIGTGLGLMAVGAAMLYAEAKLNWGELSETVQNKIMEILIATGEFLLTLGLILALSGAAIKLGLGLMAAGAVALAAAAGLDWDYFKDNIKRIIDDILVIVGTALLALGAIFVFTGVKVALGIALMALGAATLAAEAALNWNWIVTELQGSLGGIMALISGFLLVLGIILCCTGVALPLGIALIAAGAAGLVTVMALNWNAILDKLKEVWSSIKNWWNTYVAKYFTWEYWKNLGLDMINGIMDGLKSIFTKIGDWASGVWDSITSFFSRKSVKADVNTQSGEISFQSRTQSAALALQAAPIPRLAAGTVVPPNREFMAMLGDNKTETEVVSPLSTIRQAMAEALEASGFGGGNIEVNLVVDGATLARVIVPKINDMTRSAGKPVLLI